MSYNCNYLYVYSQFASGGSSRQWPRVCTGVTTSVYWQSWGRFTQDLTDTLCNTSFDIKYLMQRFFISSSSFLTWTKRMCELRIGQIILVFYCSIKYCNFILFCFTIYYLLNLWYFLVYWTRWWRWCFWEWFCGRRLHLVLGSLHTRWTLFLLRVCFFFSKPKSVNSVCD